MLYAPPLHRTAKPHQNISHHAIRLWNADILARRGVCPNPNCPVTTDITPGCRARPFLPRHLPPARAHNIPPVVTVTLPQRRALLKPPLYRPFCYSRGIFHCPLPTLMLTASYCHYENSAGVVTVRNRLLENPPGEKSEEKENRHSGEAKNKSCISLFIIP